LSQIYTVLANRFIL